MKPSNRSLLTEFPRLEVSIGCLLMLLQTIRIFEITRDCSR